MPLIRLACAALVAIQAPAPPQLNAGRPVRWALDSASRTGIDRSTAFTFVPGASEWFTITAESYDFDAALEVLDTNGKRIAADTDAGAGTNPWIVVKLPAEDVLRIVVKAQDGNGGEFLVLVREGRIDPPTGADRIRASAAYFERCGEQAVARGNPARGEESYREGGRLLSDLDRERANSLLGKAERAHDDFVAMDRSRSEASQVVRELNGADCPRVGDLISVLKPQAQRLLELGDRESYERIQSWIRDSASRCADHANEAIACIHSAWSKTSRQRGAEAEEAFSESLCLLDSLPAEARAAKLEILLYTSAWQVERADFLPALGTLERLYALDPPPGMRAPALGITIRACTGAGRFARARSLLDELSNVPGVFENPVLLGGLLHAVAELEWREGAFEDARAHLGEVMQRMLSAGHVEEAIEALTTLAVDELALGNVADAKRSYETALDLARAPSSLVSRARILLGLGKIARLSGDLPQAQKHFDEALEAARVSGERNAEAGSLDGLALIALARRDLSVARELALQAYGLNTSSGAEENALFPLATLTRIALAGIDTHDAEGRIEAAEQLLDRNEVVELGAHESAGVRSRFTEWGELAQDLAAMKIAEAARAGRNEHADVEAAWRAAGNWKARALHEGLSRLKKPSSPPAISVAELAPLLGADEAIVEYARGSERLQAYTLFRGVLRSHDLGEAASIESEVRTYAEMLAEDSSSTAASVCTPALSLHARLLTPLLPDLDGATRLRIVPTAELARLPFDALVTRTPSAASNPIRFSDLSFVLDRFEITYAPSSQVLLALTQRPSPKHGRRALLVGDPLYDPANASSWRGAESTWPPALPRLPETRKECLAIADLLLHSDAEVRAKHESHISARGSDRDLADSCFRFDLQLGRGASLELFQKDLSDYGLVHLAVHGLVDASDPRRCALALTRSGNSDGLLSIDMISRLRLDSPLVVLSACDSAAGRTLRGEGIQSLANAFLEAGAKGVVASLWQILDDQAGSTMELFYTGYLAENDPPSRALQKAKIALRHLAVLRQAHRSRLGNSVELKCAHPHFWAPFVFIG